MRPALCALFVLIAPNCAAFATTRVTLILQFDAAHSEQSVGEMKTELESLMGDAGVELSWRRIDELSAADSFPRVVVVTFHGRCEMTALAPPLPSEPAALAFTHLSNGRIIPFADVECDRIRSSLRLAHTTGGITGDLLFGRAMGRVLAHELHHILDRTRAHARHGIARKSLSPRDLIADRT